VTCHRQRSTKSYQRLKQTSERARFGAFWTFCAYYVNLLVALNMA